MWALTLHPLWAWAVAAGHKRREHRAWRPALAAGERIAVHASRADWWDVDVEHVAAAVGVRPPDAVESGAIVALATVDGVEPAPAGGWYVRLRDVERLAQPVECRGQQRLWRVPDAVAAQIAACGGGVRAAVA